MKRTLIAAALIGAATLAQAQVWIYSDIPQISPNSSGALGGFGAALQEQGRRELEQEAALQRMREQARLQRELMAYQQQLQIQRLQAERAILQRQQSQPVQRVAACGMVGNSYVCP